MLSKMPKLKEFFPSAPAWGKIHLVALDKQTLFGDAAIHTFLSLSHLRSIGPTFHLSGRFK